MISVLAATASAAIAFVGQGALQPLRLYYGAGRPLDVMVDVPHGAEVELALMDAEGNLLAPPEAAGRGVVNLGRLLPAILEVRRTAYVQCMLDGAPVDSALVVQPMLSRRQPRTEQARRPDGSPYTRIVGWGEPPPPPPETAPPEKTAGNPGDASPDAPAEPPPPEPEPEQPVFSGFRVYPERDVVLHTGDGEILLAMRPDEAPNTAWNFLELVRGGFYDGIIFHRVVPLTRGGDPFVIQAGDPTGGGEGGPGYWLPIEPSGLPHDFGVISMARADDPDSAGSQFFICLSRRGTARLDGQYCAFGEAVAGTDVIRAIAATPLADVAAGRPVDPPVIRRAELIAAPPRQPGRGRPDRPLAEQEEPPAATTQPTRVPR